MAEYFYDRQIARFLIQFAKIFSQWEVEFGTDQKGNPIIHRVPIMYGDSSRQAATIIANNSASNLPSTPLITYYISGLEYDQSRTQDPYFLDKLNVRQRALNPESGEYETTQGNAFTVERIMPVPYTLRITVDFWTSNYKQKLALMEQLGVLFNPSMEIQSTDNFIDWTSLSVVYQDRLTWTSRTIPMGSGNPIDILSWTFYMPIWISSPIKVKKMGVIQKIIASIYKGSALDDIQDEDLLLGTRQKITPYGYKLLLLGNSLQILPADEPQYPSNDTTTIPTPPNTDVYWTSVLNVYGVVRPGVSMIAIENPYLETEIMGTINFNPTDDRLLIYEIDPDTLPQNTLAPVDSIIDPETKFPGDGLPPAGLGQRYLIVNGIPEQTGVYSEWAGLTDGSIANDIIEYGPIAVSKIVSSASTLFELHLDNTSSVFAGQTISLNGTTIGTVTSVDYVSNTVTTSNSGDTTIVPLNSTIVFSGDGWFISFDSKITKTIEFVTNNKTGVQYRFLAGGWMKSYEGFVDQGDWRIII